MIHGLRIAGWILLGICLINYGTDFFFFMKERLCRYHIGRWTMDKWIPAIEQTSLKWLKQTPTVRITDNNRYILFDMVTGKYKSQTIQSWQKAALILGLRKCPDAEKKRYARLCVENYFDTTGMWREKPTRVDCGLLSYAAMLTVDDPVRIRPAIDYSLEIIKKYENGKGLISYTGGKGASDMYVDTIGLAVPFLVAYAKYYGIPAYEELGYKQLRDFHDHGLLNGTNLPNHAYDNVEGLPLGVYGWGRGTGWYILGLIESMDLFSDSEYRETIKGWIFDAANEYMRYQRADGGFGSILQSKRTYDSSATAMMAYFYAKAAGIFHSEEFQLTAERCFGKLMKCTRKTGAIDWCQGDTKAIGVFSQTYDIMPFAQGMTLWALNIMRGDN